jgi:MFS family permease
MGAILIAVVAFVSLFIPGMLLALALLKKTELHMFEILTMGFVFGLIFPASLTWIESYAEQSIHFFSFSLALFEVNCLILTIIGFILCLQQGVFKRSEKHPEHQARRSVFSNKMFYVWIILLVIMLLTFATRMVNIGVASHYFEFDPYFDMIDAKSILALGHQMLLDPSSWPVVAAGTNHRIQPILPYLEAYWYSLANSFSANSTVFSTNLMSIASSVYPPITAALMVFVIFMLLYHEYNAYIGLIGAGLTATLSVLFTTFIAGEQLLEPWGIFSLFLFFATYMLATKDMKNKRYAILAGIAFASTFLGSHYFTVDTAILMLYIVVQGIIDVLRGNMNEDFYKMNIIVIVVIGMFLAFYDAYTATPTNLNLSIAGIPFTFAGPALALLFVAVLDYVPRLAHRSGILKANMTEKGRRRLEVYLIWLVMLIILSAVFAFAGPLHHSIDQYIAVSVKFTSPSSALFATVQEYAPTGIAYNYAAAGFGMLAAELLGAPLLLWIICAAAIILILIAVVVRNSRTGVFYLAISIPLMYAGMKEAKYLPHFAAVYIMLFCILLGELLLYVDHRFKIEFKQPGIEGEKERKDAHINWQAKAIIYAVGLFFISTIVGVVYLIYTILTRNHSTKKTPVYLWGMLAAFVLIFVIGSYSAHSVVLGTSSSVIGSLSAAAQFNSASPTTSCNTLANHGNNLGYSIFCNNVPQYWIDATAWMRANVGPFAPRILSWWDYGDWINWFGNTNAVLRGDNAVPKEDYATAAMFVLGPKDNYTARDMDAVMSGNQSQYVLFDEDLVSKWGALDFLGCVDVNETSLQYAIAQGAAQSPAQPYVLGNSPCELSHDPEYVLVPLQVLIGSTNTTQIQGVYCSISNQTATFVTGYLVTGQSILNQTVCINLNGVNKNGAMQVYNSSGKKMNAMINLGFYQGVTRVGGQEFVQFLMIYTPNAPNGTVTDAPTAFYSSNFYSGFFLGKLAGFNLVYPQNSVGVNFVNGTYPIRIFKLMNYTGGLPPVLQKLPWVKNNYTVP